MTTPIVRREGFVYQSHNVEQTEIQRRSCYTLDVVKFKRRRQNAYVFDFCKSTDVHHLRNTVFTINPKYIPVHATQCFDRRRLKYAICD